MTDSREELERIVARTLGHYDASAEAFWEGTRDHDVSQNVAALLRHLEARPPFAILDLGCGPGRDLAAFRAPRPRGGRRSTARRASSRWRARTAAARSGSRTCSPSTCRRRASTASSPTPCCFTCPGSELPRVLGELRAALAPARRPLQLEPARRRRGGLEQRPLRRLPRSRRVAARRSRRPASSSSSTTTGPKACRASSSRGSRASGGAATTRRAEPAQGALIRVMAPRVRT